MSRSIREVAFRHALRLGGNACYSQGPTVVLVLGAREFPRREGVICEHRCTSAGSAEKVTQRVWEVLRNFPRLLTDLGPQRGGERLLQEAAARVEAEWRVANRRAGRRVA